MYKYINDHNYQVLKNYILSNMMEPPFIENLNIEQVGSIAT
jgi:hypothetical protein